MGYSLKIKNSKLVFRESDIVRQICKYLQAKGYFFWRHNNVGVFSKKRNTYLKSHYSIKGVPDIFIIKNDVLYGVEVKSEYGVVSKDQNDFSRKFLGKNMKFVYRKWILARSFDDFIEIFDKD